MRNGFFYGHCIMSPCIGGGSSMKNYWREGASVCLERTLKSYYNIYHFVGVDSNLCALLKYQLSNTQSL